MGRNWGHGSYLPGDAERSFAQVQFWMGKLTEEHLALADRMTAAGKAKSRRITRYLHALRGEWRLERGEWKLAADRLHEAVRMAREVGLLNADAETMLALAKFHLNELADPWEEAERLANQPFFSPRWLPELWLALGDMERAKNCALRAHKWAWADGEPYVYRYELTKSTELLQRLNVPVPELPPYDPAKNEIFPWEEDVKAMIEELKAEKEAKKRKSKAE